MDVASAVYGFWLGDLCLYIGSSPNVWRRFKQHRKDWHSCARLQTVIGELGFDSLRSEVLETQSNRVKLRAAEERWQHKLNPVCNDRVSGSNGFDNLTSEQRAAAGRKGAATTNAKHADKLSEWGRKGAAAANAEKLPNGKSAAGVKGGTVSQAKLTPQQRSELGRKGGLASGRKVCCTRWHTDRPKTDGLCAQCVGGSK